MYVHIYILQRVYLIFFTFLLIAEFFAEKIKMLHKRTRNSSETNLFLVFYILF